MRPLIKTTIVIWSEDNGSGHTFTSIEDLARDAIHGESYCSKKESMLVKNPSKDPDWEDTEFFDY